MPTFSKKLYDRHQISIVQSNTEAGPRVAVDSISREIHRMIIATGASAAGYGPLTRR